MTPTGSIVCSSVSVTCAEAEDGGHVLGGGACALGRVSAGSGRLEAEVLSLPAVERVVRRAVLAVAVHLGVGVVARSGTRVVSPLAVTHAERIGGPLVVHAARVVRVLTDEARQTVAGPRAAVHGGDGAARLCVVVDHFD